VSITNPFTNITLNGTDQSDFATLSNIDVQDQQSTPAGWNVTVQATRLQCTSSDPGCPSAGDTLPANLTRMAGPLPVGSGGSSCVPSPCGPGTLTLPQGNTPFLVDGGSAVKIASFSGGNNSYSLAPGNVDGNAAHTIKLTVPASAYGTTYHQTYTFTVATGP
jgi:hypothetical protein